VGSAHHGVIHERKEGWWAKPTPPGTAVGEKEESMDYRHTQFGTAVVISLLVGIGVTVYLSTQEVPSWVLYWIVTPVMIILAFCIFLFYSLTVEIDGKELRFRFGIGLIRRSVPLGEIEKAEPVRNRWIYGWGIHITPHGWLYNVSGMEAVQITLKSGKRLRIGTDEPRELTEAIERAREKARQ
jgi:hypothetical protein